MHRDKSRSPTGHSHGRVALTGEAAQNTGKTIRRLLAYLGPHRRPLLGVCVLAVSGTLLALTGPILLGRAIDTYIALRDTVGLTLNAALMLGVYLGRGLIGQTVALVGPTGAGKTTVVNLLSRFYDTSRGRISIDGHDIRDVQQDSVRMQLGIVLQDTFLFSATVMENIRYGRLDATDAEVIEAAKLANADRFLRHLPKGYQTRVSEQGHNFSQGQCQLISIARAILADPRILILDEATSSVDTRTEAHIQEALLHLLEGRTAFVIAHRLSTIRNADTVLVINDHRIIERGPHEKLMELSGFYHKLYMTQFRRA